MIKRLHIRDDNHHMFDTKIPMLIIEVQELSWWSEKWKISAIESTMHTYDYDYVLRRLDKWIKSNRGEVVNESDAFVSYRKRQVHKKFGF